MRFKKFLHRESLYAPSVVNQVLVALLCYRGELRVDETITQHDLLWEMLQRKNAMSGRYSVIRLTAAEERVGSALPGTGPVVWSLKVPLPGPLHTGLFLLHVPEMDLHQFAISAPLLNSQ
jgi:hypothetical protein